MDAQRINIVALLALFLTLITLPNAQAQSTDQAIYTDSLQNGWQSYGWAAMNFSNTSPVHTGADSISVSAAAWQAMYLHCNTLDTTPYVSLSFWINGGPNGGQRLQVQALLNGVSQAAYALPALAPNTWQQVTIPLSALGAAAQPNMTGFWIQDVTGTTQPTFYVDDITLVGSNVAAPTSANLQVNTAAPLQTLDSRVYGLNTAVWDSQLTSASTQSALAAIQPQILRFPGGSTSDDYNWSTGRSGTNTWQWSTTFAGFVRAKEALGAQAYVTVNYGSGTPEEAAAWVAYANGSATNTSVIGTDVNGINWGTVGFWASLRSSAPLSADDGYNFLRISHPASCNIRYWEIGNECYGSWENDLHGAAGSNLSGVAHDAYTYATWAQAFYLKMKAVDPTIKVGAVAISGEDAWGDGQHAVPNPNESNSLHSGWTPVVLATLRTAGVTPDYIIDHNYAQGPGSENDSTLLQSGSRWSGDAVNLRRMLTDYVGAAASGVELAATETNSVSSSPGKQSTSLVNGLFFADNLAGLAQTEFKSCVWWDIHNGSQTNDNNSVSLYGWRQFGDYGILADGDRSDTPTNMPYPSYYAAKLLTHWARGGDQIVSAASDYRLLSVYAAKLQSGNLALLVINKSPTADLTGHINLGSFAPGSGTAAVYTYGKAQDAGNADLAQGTITNAAPTFDYLFPSYSMTVIVIAGPVALAPVTLPTIADAYVRSPGWDTTNFGASNQLQVKKMDTTGTFNRVSYLKFDLTNITHPITNAKLALTLNSASAQGSITTSTLKVYGIASNNWAENTLTWRIALAGLGLNSNTTSSGTPAGSTNVGVSQTGVVNWDLTSYLQSKIGQIVTLQVIDENADNTYFVFNSKEAATGQPALTLSF